MSESGLYLAFAGKDERVFFSWDSMTVRLSDVGLSFGRTRGGSRVVAYCRADDFVTLTAIPKDVEKSAKLWVVSPPRWKVFCFTFASMTRGLKSLGFRFGDVVVHREHGTFVRVVAYYKGQRRLWTTVDADSSVIWLWTDVTPDTFESAGVA